MKKIFFLIRKLAFEEFETNENTIKMGKKLFFDFKKKKKKKLNKK